MKLNSKLLIIAAFIALVIPLVFMGNASAMYTGDGATHDATTTGWKLPAANGTTNGCLADPTKTNSRACNTVKFPAYTDGAACSASSEFAAGQAEWSTSSCSLSLENHDRNALVCASLGGTSSAACQAKWTDPPAVDTRPGTITGNECLRCHSTTIQRNGYVARWKDSYVKTGHKNMLRKVSAGQPWAGPDGVVYDVHAAGSGTTIDWTNATVTTTSLTPPTRALYYIYGDWMAPAPSLIYDNSATGNGTSAKYTCASCHTTGYVATNFLAGMEPNNTYPSLTSGITGSWDMNGIVCSRCHNSGTNTTDAFRAGLDWGSDLTFSTHTGQPAGAKAAALCIECHNSTQTKADPAGQLKTAASGQNFSGHILGNQFLNSPHAKFTGSSSFVGTAANYASTFRGGDEYAACKLLKAGVTSTSGQIISEVEAKTEADCVALAPAYGVPAVPTTAGGADGYIWTPQSQGNCSTCHDVHQSIVPEVGAAEPLRRECTTCHDGGIMPEKNLGAMKHPTTAGTPAGIAGANASIACEICHMATMSPEGSTHLPPHLWRINTSASYRTFPTSAEWSAGTKIANTSPDGSYTNAVWVDLDLACGQCHGGSAGTFATKSGAPYMSKAYLAVVADNMHFNAGINQAPTASFTQNTNPTPYTVSLTDTSSDDGALPASAISINWGDGKSSTGNAGATITHTYATAGTFAVMYTVKDADGAYDSTTTSVSVPVRYSITVNLIGAGFPDVENNAAVGGDNDGICELGETCVAGTAKVILKKNGVTKKVEKEATTALFDNRKPGNYKVKVYKKGYTFTCDLASTVPDEAANPINVTIGPDQVVNCTY